MLVPGLQAISLFAFVSFALRFPSMEPAGVSQRAERFLWLGVAPTVIAANVCSGAIIIGMRFPSALTSALQLVIAMLYIPGIAILIFRYIRSEQQERTRLRWAVAAFSIAFLPYITFTGATNGP
ncbi:MAG: hypothetical protein NVS9B12_14000 [Vulcanimicrobiaceae bacterium]